MCGGVVVDSSGDPLTGVNITEVGTSNGTISDMDGNFALTVASSNAQLQFSYIGFQSVTLRVSVNSEMRVVLTDDTQALEDVVVVGYGVMKKKLLTGATVQVKGDDIQRLNTTTPLGALQSQLPGVNITQNSGMPGSDYKVVIRGLGTIGSSGPCMLLTEWPEVVSLR